MSIREGGNTRSRRHADEGRNETRRVIILIRRWFWLVSTESALGAPDATRDIVAVVVARTRRTVLHRDALLGYRRRGRPRVVRAAHFVEFVDIRETPDVVGAGAGGELHLLLIVINVENGVAGVAQYVCHLARRRDPLPGRLRHQLQRLSSQVTHNRQKVGGVADAHAGAVLEPLVIHKAVLVVVIAFACVVALELFGVLGHKIGVAF
mmetsp:Transcript_15735/g.27944  ORF Transcript_15735/g.27944 Transcript_15735/m.27944 type:complete len:208 (-) Transcript_15735:422-1045(-)